MEKIFVTKSSMPPFEEYIEKIRPLWNTHMLTNMGMYHTELEKRMCELCEVDYVSLMVNGHMALEMAIQSFGFPKGSEVITTPFTFISTTHAIVRNNLKPVFCDVKDDYTIDEELIEGLITEKTVAIVPVHVYGNICNVEKIDEIAKKHNLKVIYDAAHAFTETYKGRNVGSFGDASIFSFHATKVFNTIEGGAICTNSKELYDKFYNLKNFGIKSEECVEAVGANAKMNEFQAAFGLCNLNHLSEEIEKRRHVVEIYNEELENIDTLRTMEKNPKVTYNSAYYPLLFENQETRDLVWKELRKNEIYARKYFYPITCDAKCYELHVDGLCKARDFSSRILVLPLYSELEEENARRICKIIKETI